MFNKWNKGKMTANILSRGTIQTVQFLGAGEYLKYSRPS